MVKKIIFLLLFVFEVVFLNAGNIIIKGKATKFAGSELTIYKYKDYITEIKQKIGYIKIGADESFSFEFETTEIDKIILAIEDKSTWFFAEPGSVYNLTISYDEAANKSRIYDRFLSLRFSFPAPTELNQLIAKYNKKIDDFITENDIAFRQRNGSVIPLLLKFEKKTTTEFSAYSNKFLTEYVRYSLANTFLAINVSYSKNDTIKLDKTMLYLKYLHNKPVHYNSPEYVAFFKIFFNGEFKTLTLKIPGIDITKAINEQNSYAELTKALAKYPFLQNDEFKGLFIINGLREIYNDKYFKQQNILTLLNHIKENSPYNTQQKIATNVIEKLTVKKLGKGTKAPNFGLKNQTNKTISLTDFEGKYIYINFWATWSIPSQKEMKIIELLHNKYKEKIEFVSICTDNDKAKMDAFLKENPSMKWTFLHIGESRSLLQEYEVRTFPTYILIGKEGEIIEFPAPRPSSGTDRLNEENLERLFYELK